MLALRGGQRALRQFQRAPLSTIGDLIARMQHDMDRHFEESWDDVVPQDESTTGTFRAMSSFTSTAADGTVVQHSSRQYKDSAGRELTEQTRGAGDSRLTRRTFKESAEAEPQETLLVGGEPAQLTADEFNSQWEAHVVGKALPASE